MSKNTDRKVKGSFLARQRNLIIALVIIFAVLVIGFALVIKPLLNDDTLIQGNDEPIKTLPGEVLVGTRILMYQNLERADIDNAVIHNPSNDKQYIDWGFYVKKELTKNENGENVETSSLYLTNYSEGLPTDSTAISQLVTGIGYPVVTSRVEEHCTDFAKYGLENSDGEHDEIATYYVLTARNGTVHKVYIGDKILSGSGYYVRCADEIDGKVRDSVYIMSASTLEASALTSPVKIVTPIITFPLNLNSPSGAMFDAFSIMDNNGALDVFLAPATDTAKDPMAAFASMAMYKTVTPAGYFGSTSFESLNEIFSDFQGSEVLEIAPLVKKTDEETGEVSDEYEFSNEVLARYGLDTPRYYLDYYTQGYESKAYFSDKTADGCYYVYSDIFRTVVKLPSENAYFLEWETKDFIQTEVFSMMIDKCDSVTVKSEYGTKDIDKEFKLSGKGKELVVNVSDRTRPIETDNFRSLYQVMIQIYLRDSVPEDVDISKLMENTPYAEVGVTTRNEIVYKTDANGNATSKFDYELKSVSKIFRFYKYTNGHCLCTIEVIDENGVSSGESGDFYVLTSRIDKLLSDTVKASNDELVDKRERK